MNFNKRLKTILTAAVCAAFFAGCSQADAADSAEQLTLPEFTAETDIIEGRKTFTLWERRLM